MNEQGLEIMLQKWSIFQLNLSENMKKFEKMLEIFDFYLFSSEKCVKMTRFTIFKQKLSKKWQAKVNFLIPVTVSFHRWLLPYISLRNSFTKSLSSAVYVPYTSFYVKYIHSKERNFVSEFSSLKIFHDTDKWNKIHVILVRHTTHLN